MICINFDKLYLLLVNTGITYHEESENIIAQITINGQDDRVLLEV